jgi:hypothetical protein
MNPREITYDNFLSYAAKFKSERARTALIKNKAQPHGAPFPYLLGGPTYYKSSNTQFLYIGVHFDNLKALELKNGLLSTTPVSQSPDTLGLNGTTPVVSSLGSNEGTAVVWAITRGADWWSCHWSCQASRI